MGLDAQACFEAYRGLVYRWARAMCRHDADAADLLQEVFLRLVRSQPLFADERAALGWLRSTTSRLAIDRWRRRDHLATGSELIERAASPATGGAAVATQRENADLARQALLELSEQQRLVLLARCYDDRTFAQIADELGVSTPTVKTHYVRGLRALRDRLGLQGGTGANE